MKNNFINTFYETIIKGDSYYNYLVKDFINSRSHIKNQILVQHRDRGNKYNLVWDFFISPIQAESFMKKHSSEISFFKTFLNLKTNNDVATQLDDLQDYIQHLNTKPIINVAQHNYYECYGICMILFNLLNRAYISSRLQTKSTPYNLLRLTHFYAMTYYKYHLNCDILKTVDVLSNFARMHDYFGNETITILLDGDIFNPVGVKFMYVWAMQKSYNVLPNNVRIKLHYHTNARMMYQNQTVGGVVDDSFETPFSDCCKLGEAFAIAVLEKYESLIENNNELIDSEQLDEDWKEIIINLKNDVIKNNSINWMQFLNKTIQLENFDGIHIIEPPYIPSPFHYLHLVKKMGLTEEQLSKLDIRDETNIPDVKYILQIPDIMGECIPYSFETERNLKGLTYHQVPKYRDLTLFLDENKNIIMIKIVGNNLYPIKKEIDWRGIFYGIPCQITLYDFPNRLYEDMLFLVVFGNKKSLDYTFNAEYC